MTLAEPGVVTAISPTSPVGGVLELGVLLTYSVPPV
jgi:hypothetical protein